MKKRTDIVFGSMLVLMLLMGACQAAPEIVIEEPETDIYLPVIEAGADAEVEAVETEEGPAQQHAQVLYAQGFTLEYFDDYKLLTVTQPWLGATEGFSYMLVQRGSQIPTETQGALVVEVPIRSIVTMSTTYFPHLEMLGKLDTLVGVDDVTYVYNAGVQQMASDGRLAIVGGGASGGTVNLEALLEVGADLIMTSASGIPELDAHPKLIEAGLPVVINGDYLENSPLGRAEWGKFIAAFYNMEGEAEKQFDALVERYQHLNGVAMSASFLPTVFTNTDFQGSWYVPGGQSYAALLLRDAGARYLWAEDGGTGALPLSFEEVFDSAHEADYWLNVGFASNLAGLLAMDERYAGFKAFEAGQVYNYNKRVSANGGMDYFESGAANPDLVLADLIAIFHPQLLPGHEFTYYQQLH